MIIIVHVLNTVFEAILLLITISAVFKTAFTKSKDRGEMSKSSKGPRKLIANKVNPRLFFH